MHNKITVNGVPLDQHLKEEHERTKAAELKQVLGERVPVYRPVRDRVSIAPLPVSPIKVYSKAEVKMQDLLRKIQAEKSATRKILAVLISGQSFTAKGIATITETKLHTVQGIISKINNPLVMGLDYLEYSVNPNSKNERAYNWSGPPISIDKAHQEFLKLVRASKHKVEDSISPDLSQPSVIDVFDKTIPANPVNLDSNFPGLDAFLAHCQANKYKVTITIEV